MTAATAAAATTTTATVATSTAAKPKTGDKKEYKAPAPSAPSGPRDAEKALLYVRCRTCKGGKGKVQFHHVVTICVLFLLAYALLSVVVMVNNALDQEVSRNHVRITKYNELKQNYTSLQEMYNGLQKKMDALSNQPEEPSNEKRYFTSLAPLMLREHTYTPVENPRDIESIIETRNRHFQEMLNNMQKNMHLREMFNRLQKNIPQEYITDAEILRHTESTPETESTTQTETGIQKEVTTNKGSEEVTSNTDEEEKTQIIVPSASELWNNKSLLEKIRLCVQSPKNCQ